MQRQHYGNVKRSYGPPPGQPSLSRELPFFALEQSRQTLARLNTARFLIQQTIEQIDEELYEIPMPHVEEGYPEYDLGNLELPAYDKKAEIIDAINHNQVVILVGETGSGKSTQVPQYLLEKGYQVHVSEPRRMATYSVAERIQDELNETLGYLDAAGLVGYRTQEKNTVTERTRIGFYTDGITLLEAFDETPSDGKKVMVIDEAHEENQNMTLITGLAVDRVKKDPNYRFVITSATMNAPAYADFVEQQTGKRPPIVEIKGRQYDVEIEERSHSDVVNMAHEIVNSDPDEDILIFVAGTKEINDTINGVWKKLSQQQRAETTFVPLHAKLSEQEQRRATDEVVGRKIIVATDVAQTSITIPSVGRVIDSGEVRKIRLDEYGDEGLFLETISHAECMQRAGRCGRVKPGKYFLVPYDKHSTHVPLDNRPEFPEPEIVRTNFDRSTLRFAARGRRLLDLPLPVSIQRERILRSEQSLRMVEALDDEGSITALGRTMDKFPLSVSSARIMVESLQYPAEIRAYVAAMTASLEVGGLPYYVDNPKGNFEALTSETSSDMLAQLDLFIQANGLTKNELAAHDYDVRNVLQAQHLYRRICRLAGIEKEIVAPPTLTEDDQILSCIYAGMVDNLYQFAGKQRERALYRSATSSAEEIRVLSNRSVVQEETSLIIGEPYMIEARSKKGKIFPISMLTNASAVTDPNKLAEVAPYHTGWQHEGHVWRNGKMHVVERQTLAGLALQQTRERPAAPSEEVYAAVLANVRKRPGPALQYLRLIKKQTEELGHLTDRRIKVITERMLEGWISQAAPRSVTAPYQVDDNLRKWIAENSITLETFISAKDQAAIRRNAPTEVQLGELKLRLNYRNGVPIAHHFEAMKVINLPDEVRLADGRVVHFYYDKRRHTVASLRQKLSPGTRLAGAAK